MIIPNTLDARHSTVYMIMTTDSIELALAKSAIKELSNTHEPIQEIMMVFLKNTANTLPLITMKIPTVKRALLNIIVKCPGFSAKSYNALSGNVGLR